MVTIEEKLKFFMKKKRIEVPLVQGGDKRKGGKACDARLQARTRQGAPLPSGVGSHPTPQVSLQNNPYFAFYLRAHPSDI